jgi:hypothetical protein
MPLPSRVSPFGDLFATPARGTLMGNRGGRLHDARQKLATRRWANKAWICCKLDFNDRHRTVWGDSYTELFFLDEVTAFAAGHRPCFECRRKDAERFAALYAPATRAGQRATAPDMDAVLHLERLDGKAKRIHRRRIDDLPDGAMIAQDGQSLAVRGAHLLPWTPAGYTAPQPRPRGIDADVLTPPATLAVLARGYQPQWHASAGTMT